MKKISQEKISTHIQEVPQEKIEQWKSLYEKYKSILKVNSKSVLEIIEFLKRKYVIVEETSEEFKHVVINNIKLNKPFSQKISSDKELKPIVFTIPNEGNAKKLYDTQEEIYSGCKIIVGMDFETGCVFVEGDLKDIAPVVASQKAAFLVGTDGKELSIVSDKANLSSKFAQLLK